MDDKSKKQLMVIGALLPVLLIAWVMALGSCGVFNRKPPATAAAAAPQAAEPFAPAVTTEKNVVREERIQKFADAQWARNPFRIGVVASAPVVVRAPGRTQLPNMRLEGIVWDNRSPFAVIDGELRTIGDTLSGFVVQDIKKDRVILERNGDLYELGLFPELK